MPDVKLDPDRRRAAQTRMTLALRAAKHHERMAAAERAKAEQIARTWQIELSQDLPAAEA